MSVQLKHKGGNVLGASWFRPRGTAGQPVTARQAAYCAKGSTTSSGNYKWVSSITEGTNVTRDEAWKKEEAENESVELWASYFVIFVNNSTKRKRKKWKRGTMNQRCWRMRGWIQDDTPSSCSGIRCSSKYEKIQCNPSIETVPFISSSNLPILTLYCLAMPRTGRKSVAQHPSGLKTVDGRMEEI